MGKKIFLIIFIFYGFYLYSCESIEYYNPKNEKSFISNFITYNWIYFSSDKLLSYLQNNYPSSLSSSKMEQIVNSIQIYAFQYGINPLLLISVIQTESNFKHYILHPIRTITIRNRKLTINAIGLGGIVWEIWKDELMKNKIAMKREDLFNIRNNIHAIAYVLNKYYWFPKVKNHNKLESVLLRYFGGYHTWYIKRVKKVMKTIVKNYYIKYCLERR